MATRANSSLGQMNRISRRHFWISFLVKLLQKFRVHFLCAHFFLMDMDILKRNVKYWRIFRDDLQCIILSITHILPTFTVRLFLLDKGRSLGAPHATSLPFFQEIPNCINSAERKHVYSYMGMEVFCEEGLMVEGSQHPLLLVCTEIHSAT